MAGVVVRGITKGYGAAPAVRDASLEIGAGEMLVVTGPRRAGKSTLLRVISGIEPADAGSVEIGGRELSRSDLEQVVSVMTGRAPEADVTVRQSLTAALRAAGLGEREVRRRLHQAARLLGARELGRRLAKLDERQRTMYEMARAIALEPEAIVIDDVLSPLPDRQRRSAFDQLLRLRGRRGTAVVYATGDPREALALGDRVAVMDAGTVEQVASPRTLLTAPATAGVATHFQPGLALHDERMEGRRVLVGRPSSGKSRLLFDPVTRRSLDPETPRAEPPRPLEGAARTAAAEGAEPRWVNVWLEHRGRPLRPHAGLRPRTSYDVHVDIGPYADASVVANAEQAPFPRLPLPDVDDGHWLQLVASSDELELEGAVQCMFLPLHGRAWMCTCPHDRSHTCRPDERRYDARFAVRTGSEAAEARLRLTVYHRLNAVQSLRLDAQVGRPGGHSCTIDYSLTAHLADVGRLQPRALAIVANESPNGMHHLYFNDDDGTPFDYRLTEAQVGVPAISAREELRALQTIPARRKRERAAFGTDNEKSRDAFVVDLLRLAKVGRTLLSNVFPVAEQRIRVVETLRQASVHRDGRAVIHVANTADNTLAFPWQLVYDIPLSMDPRPCPWLETWDPRDPPAALPARCPNDDGHEGVICPFGFWGFAHQVEAPPFAGVDVPPSGSIRTVAGEPPLSLAVAASPQLPREAARAHLCAIRTIAGTAVDPAWDARSILTNLAADVDVAYFYCHGERRLSPSGMVLGPLLVFAKGDTIEPGDIFDAAVVSWPQSHWTVTRPLVFINGCHTTDITPELLSDFVRAFVASHASGVIGTEVAITQEIAGEAAQELLSALRLDGATVGSALQHMRRALMAKGNVMGLAYTAYCSVDLSVQP